jgi:hypothetical protein
MADAIPLREPDGGEGEAHIHLILEDYGERLRELESSGKKTIIKRITEDAGAVALLLGLILTVASVYDVFVVQPRSAKIAAISQFNEAVNAAAKTREDLIKDQAGTENRSLRLQLVSSATPQILNDIATAKALLGRLGDEDVGIPQLSILINESFTAGDIKSAGVFANRAVNNPYATLFEHSEAMRFQGRYHFLSNQPVEARAAYQAALDALADEGFAGARAFDLSDWAFGEYYLGQCAAGEEIIKRFRSELGSPRLSNEQRTDLVASLKSSLEPYRAPPQPCASSVPIDSLLAGDS